MALRLLKNSVLRFSELLEANDVQFWDIQEIPEIPVSQNDQYIQVSPNDRLDILAYNTYGDVQMKYVIAVANDIEINPTQLIPGTLLRLPDPDALRVLFQQNRKS